MRQIEKWANTKLAAQYKIGHQIQKWHKRSFYQGPGVKFPFSWEKITLPPGLLWLFYTQNYPPLKPDFSDVGKILFRGLVFSIAT